MADCFSMPNAVKLVEKFRRTKENGWYGNEYAAQIIILRDLWEAADAIEQLLAENAKLKKERDAFMRDFLKGFKEQIEEYHGKYRCDICKHGVEQRCDIGECNGFSKWEWRGVQKD